MVCLCTKMVVLWKRIRFYIHYSDDLLCVIGKVLNRKIPWAMRIK